MWFIGVEVEQETSAPPPKTNPGSAPAIPFGDGTRTTNEDLLCVSYQSLKSKTVTDPS